MPGSSKSEGLCDHVSQESGHLLHVFPHFEFVIVGLLACLHFLELCHREIFVEFHVTWIERSKNGKEPSCTDSIHK